MLKYYVRTISKERFEKLGRNNSSSTDVYPRTKKVIIKKSPNKTKNNLTADKPVENLEDKSDQLRINEVNIQMVSKNLFQQLFEVVRNVPSEDIIKSCQNHLIHHGIDYNNCSRLPDVDLRLPKLGGRDLVEHFYNIGETQAAPYRSLLIRLTETCIPELPKSWLIKPGWHKYDGESITPVPCPTDDALVFDVEVLMSAGTRPTLACALSPHAWYGWVSDYLITAEPQERPNILDYNDLIPFETDGNNEVGNLSRPRIIVGHNVSYDRAKIKEQYWIERTGVRFMDTMSMHTCVSGVTSYQRAVLKSKTKEPDPSDDTWMDISSLNSLSDVHKLYCGKLVDKDSRNIFVEGSLQDVRDNFQRLMQYCAGDVIANLNVLKELLPLFLERFPHPVTLAGMLELGSAYLPVNSNWLQYLDSSETSFEDSKLESRHLLSRKADEACRLMVNEDYRRDLWMWDQDWSTQSLKLKKQSHLYQAKCKKKQPEVSDENNSSSTVSDNLTSIAADQKIDDNLHSNDKCKQELNLRRLDANFINSLHSDSAATANAEDRDKLNKEFEYLYELKRLLPVKRPYLAGYPAWYRKLCTKPERDPDWTPGANNITTSMQITPKLLRLSWEGYPLHHIKGEGWGFLVPFSHTRPVSYEPEPGEPQIPLEELVKRCPVAGPDTSADEERSEETLYRLAKNVEQDMGKRSYYARKKLDEQAKQHNYTGLGVWCGKELQGCCHFLRLPHKDGPKYKVGNPLAKDFLDKFSQNVLTAQGDEAEKVLNLGRMMSYWRNNRERIQGQQLVWLPEARLPPTLRAHSHRRYGAILPQVVVCGTLTRRASEPTWMTASNAHKERIGSELRAMVQAPPGYKFVGADVDSQELWIASLLGDSAVGVIGGTALGWAVLAGSKQAGTDLHSLTARAARISRDHAKVINYARIYGAGQNFAERLLKQFNPTMSGAEAKSKAAKMFTTTKGRRVYKLRPEYTHSFMEEDADVSCEVPAYQAARLAKLSSKRVEEMFERPKWVGGTESEMFNKLEEIADSERPCTAFLSGRLSRALESSGGRWAGTRLNWAVQSAAADFLHLMLVCMRHLAPPTARFCLSFHDEVRYLVPDEDRYRTALALQLTNLMTRAFCSQRVGLNDLPLSVAFFTSVEVDQVLRKESNLCCTTPSNPHGLEKGYGIPTGESLDIFEVIKKCGVNKK